MYIFTIGLDQEKSNTTPEAWSIFFLEHSQSIVTRTPPHWSDIVFRTNQVMAGDYPYIHTYIYACKFACMYMSTYMYVYIVYACERGFLWTCNTLTQTSSFLYPPIFYANIRKIVDTWTFRRDRKDERLKPEWNIW